MMSRFPIHTIESAPERSKPLFVALKQAVGMVPDLAAGMAESPQFLEGILAVREIYGKGTFSGGEIEVLSLTAASENDCGWCVAFHSLMAGKNGVPVDVIDALRAGRSPDDAPELQTVRVALDAILAKQEPYPAVVMNRTWDILTSNTAATRFFGSLLGDAAVASPQNVVRMMFDPAGLRPFVSNWEAVA